MQMPEISIEGASTIKVCSAASGASLGSFVTLPRLGVKAQ